MDSYDIQILNILQENGKISVAELARIIELSPTATKERIKKLESEGIIKGYSAVIDYEKVGFSLISFITVPVGDMTIKEMENHLTGLNEIMECHKVTGGTCFLVKAITKDTQHLERLIDNINNYAKNTYTYIVLSTYKDNRNIKLD
ncbi:MAG: Lrp/AsnC family transcriptional regulator [Firmicutes bacterium]|jgi:Lrp/AsnC family leucine-responsive transcriptional regulator|nr:Lrp/AsnC family transcriptional regulator [Bacillota bacterium]